MAHAPIDIDLQGPSQRPNGLLLDVARPLTKAQLSANGIERWPLAGVTWVPWDCHAVVTTSVGCEVLTQMSYEDYATIQTMKAFRLHDGLKCSDLSGIPAEMDARINHNLTIQASKVFATELMRGTFGGPDSFKTDAAANQLAGGAARTIRLGFSDIEKFAGQKLHGGKGVVHVPTWVFVLAVADGLVRWDGNGWVTPTGHDVVADAGYEGLAPTGGSAPTTDQAWVYFSGPVYYAITAPDPIGARNQEALDMTRNVYQLLGERYGLVAYDPCSVGAVKVTVA